MRVGLVLGAGGVVGAAWLIGALDALEQETGFHASAADRIVGTSAGSAIGALAAAGYAGASIAGYTTGVPLDEIAELEELGDRLSDRSVGSEYRLALVPPPIGPGSWRMAVSTVLRPRSISPARLLSAVLPRGFVRTDPIRDLIERFITADWPDHPGYAAVACDYATGERVAFGMPGAPPASVGQAVAASCAIPAFYQPVRIGGRRYVDGGIHSPSNIDLLLDADLDLVVCLSPMSSRARVPVKTAGDRFAAAVRGTTGRALGREARLLRERGTDVLLIQPSRADLAVMGTNLMARDRRAEVVETARASTIRALRRLGDDQTVPDSAPPRERSAKAVGSPELTAPSRAATSAA
jgi:NTE family protein